MNQNVFTVNTMHRPVGYTHCAQGRYDLQPQSILPFAGYGEIVCDFEAQACRFPSTDGANDQHWFPAYLAEPNNDASAICADLLAFDLPGISADHAHRWLSETGMAGLAYPTVRDSLTSPHCCLVVLLNRPVSAPQYATLWQRIADHVFGDRPSMEQADFRYRIPYPRMTNGAYGLLKAVGAALHVEFALSREKFDGNTAGKYSVEHTKDAWMASPFSSPVSE